MSQVWDSPYAKHVKDEKGNWNVSHAKLLVMLKLADHASDEGWCFPSQQRIANMCGLTRQSVNEIVQALEADGVLEIHRTIGKHNRYQLRFENIPVGSADTSTPVGSGDRYLSAQVTPPVGSADTNHKVTVKGKRQARASQTPAEFIAELSASPAYAHINVPHEAEKAKVWLAGKSRRQFSRQYLVNWLNRIDPPVDPATLPFEPASQNGKLIPTSPPRLSDLPTLADLPLRSIGGAQ